MTLLQRTPGALFLFVLGGGVFGGLLAEMLLFFSPSDFLKNVFLKQYPIGFTTPVTLDLFMLTFTIGFAIRINLMILLGILLGIYMYKHV